MLHVHGGNTLQPLMSSTILRVLEIHGARVFMLARLRWHIQHPVCLHQAVHAVNSTTMPQDAYIATSRLMPWLQLTQVTCRISSSCLVLAEVLQDACKRVPTESTMLYVCASNSLEHGCNSRMWVREAAEDEARQVLPLLHQQSTLAVTKQQCTCSRCKEGKRPHITSCPSA